MPYNHITVTPSVVFIMRKPHIRLTHEDKSVTFPAVRETAVNISMVLSEREFERPLLHHRLLNEFTLREACITRVDAEGRYYGYVTLGDFDLELMPSDVVLFALLAGLPLTADASLFNQQLDLSVFENALGDFAL